MRRLLLAIIAGGVIVVLVVTGHFLLVHLSQETGTSDEASRSYAYWSGFGSVFPWSLGILGGMVVFYRTHECHNATCHWPGVHPTKDGHKLCKKCIGRPPHELKLHFIHPHHRMTAEERADAGIDPVTGEQSDAHIAEPERTP